MKEDDFSSAIGTLVNIKLPNGLITEITYEDGCYRFNAAFNLWERQVIIKDIPLEAIDLPPKSTIQETVTAPVRPVSDTCTDTETALVNAKRAVRAWLTGKYQDRDRQEVDTLRDSLAASLDARVQMALDAILSLRASESSETLTPEDGVEIIIDPTPEQVPEGGRWGCWWDFETDDLGVGRLSRTDVLRTGWRHFAILVRGHLTPCELVARVRKMLAEKEGK